MTPAAHFIMQQVFDTRTNVFCVGLVGRWSFDVAKIHANIKKYIKYMQT